MRAAGRSTGGLEHQIQVLTSICATPRRELTIQSIFSPAQGARATRASARQDRVREWLPLSGHILSAASQYQQASAPAPAVYCFIAAQRQLIRTDAPQHGSEHDMPCREHGSFRRHVLLRSHRRRYVRLEVQQRQEAR